MFLPRGHIGENHLIADLQALNNFDGVYGAAAKFDGDANGAFAIINELEERGLALGLALDGPAHIQNIVEVFELDGAVHAEIRARPRRKRIVECDIHGDSAVLDGRVHADDVTFDNPIMAINFSELIG